jgi:tetratricopeptide (TPR) repeat protein
MSRHTGPQMLSEGSPGAPCASCRPRLHRGWLAAGIGTLCFLNSLFNGFTYDDLALVRDNPRIRSVTDLRGILLSDWWQPQTAEQEVIRRQRDRLYRPLTMFSFALNYAACGLNPFGYHLVNVVLHAAVCILVYRLAERLVEDDGAAALAAVLFAVHPVHCEAVANVVGRAEILAALFMLLGLLALCSRRGLASSGRVLAAAGLFTAALFSKETAACYLPVALISLEATTRGRMRPWRWWLRCCGLLLVPLAVYLPLRYVALEGHLLRDALPHEFLNPLVLATRSVRLLHSFTVLGHYVRLLVLPARLSCNYGLAVIVPQARPELLTFVGAASAGVLVAALAGYARGGKLWRQLATLSAIWIASYALISNTVVLIGVSVAERLAYWPSVPAAAAVGVIAVHVWRRMQLSQSFSPTTRFLVRTCGAGVLIASGLRSVVRNADWANNLTLFAQDVATFPASAELNEALAHELLLSIPGAQSRQEVQAMLRRADRHLQAALKIAPRSQSALALRGRVLAMLGQREQAIMYFERAMQLGPLDRVARQMLWHLADPTGQAARALAELAAQVSTRPAEASLRRDYGRNLLDAGRYAEALAELELAARLAPDDADAWRLLGDACAVNNEPARAVEAWRQAVKLDPQNWQTHVNLSAVLATSGDLRASLEHARRAYELRSDAVLTNQRLAEALALTGDLASALALYERVRASLPPDDPLLPAVIDRISQLRQGRP